MAILKGDHIYTRRLGYTHHGIYVGNRQVIHYSGSAEFLKKGPITRTTLASFGDGRSVRAIKRRDGAYSRAEVVRRAEQRLSSAHKEEYNLVSNNCEHFANWCVYGESTSHQVRVVSAVAMSAVAMQASQAMAAPTGTTGPVVAAANVLARTGSARTVTTAATKYVGSAIGSGLGGGAVGGGLGGSTAAGVTAFAGAAGLVGAGITAPAWATAAAGIAIGAAVGAGAMALWERLKD